MFIDYAGYGYYFFYLPFGYLLLKKIWRYVDKTFLLLLCWGMSYAFSNVLFSQIGYATIFCFVINFPVLYLAGKFLIRKNSFHSVINYLYIFSLSISLISIVSVLIDISINGFFVLGMGRNVPMIGINNAEGYIAATGISTRLLLIISFIGSIFANYSKKQKMLFLLAAIIAIYCTIRIQSRTSIVAMSLYLITSFFYNYKQVSRKVKLSLLIILLVICSFCSYILIVYADQLAVLERFDLEDIEGGGGRVERSIEVIYNLPKYLIGGMNLNHNIPYAHNLWLDCARVAGIIPMFLLFIICGIYLKYLLFILSSNQILSVFRLTVLLLTIGLFIVFCAEPILEGIPMTFAFFCVLLGILKEARFKKHLNM